MGHANRPRLHDAFSLDAQSRRICFPITRQRDSNPYTHCKSHDNSGTYTYANGHSNSNTYGHTQTDTYAKAQSDTATSPDTAASSLSPDSRVIGKK